MNGAHGAIGGRTKVDGKSLVEIMQENNGTVANKPVGTSKEGGKNTAVGVAGVQTSQTTNHEFQVVFAHRCAIEAFSPVVSVLAKVRDASINKVD